MGLFGCAHQLQYMGQVGAWASCSLLLQLQGCKCPAAGNSTGGYSADKAELPTGEGVMGKAGSFQATRMPGMFGTCESMATK